MSRPGESREKRDDRYYQAGKRRVALSVVLSLLGDLDDGSPEKTAARLKTERMETIARLRSVCAEHGDNEWSDELHLADVIEKHLERHLDAKEVNE